MMAGMVDTDDETGSNKIAVSFSCWTVIRCYAFRGKGWKVQLSVCLDFHTRQNSVSSDFPPLPVRQAHQAWRDARDIPK